MKRILHILILILISKFALSQESNLISFLPSTCDPEENIDNRISGIYFKNDTLIVSVGFAANCGYSDTPLEADAKYINDTLYLTYGFEHNGDTVVENGDTVIFITERYYECDCCYEFYYLIRDVPSTKIPIKLNERSISFNPEKYKNYPIKFEILNGDTINYIDKYGLRQGSWLVKDTNGFIFMDRYYKNDTISKGTDYRYYEN